MKWEFDLESPVMGAQELLRFSCVRELLEAYNNDKAET